MPSDLLGLVIVFALALLPGAGLALGLSRRLGFTIADSLPLALAVSAAMAGLLSLFGTGLRLDVAAMLYAGATAVAWGAGWLIGRGAPRPKAGEPGLWLMLVVVVTTMIERPWYGRPVDAFYHLAAVRSLLATGRAIPADPIYGIATSSPDPTSGALHTMMAMWSLLTRIDPEVLWVGLTALGASLTVLAFWSLARRVSRSTWAATWAAVGFWLFVLFADGRAYAYPNRLSFALVFAAMMVLVELADRGSWPAAVLSGVALFAAGSVHLGSALLAIVFAALLVFWKLVYAVSQRIAGERVELQPLAYVLGTVTASFALMLPLILQRAAPVAAGNLQPSLIYTVLFFPLWDPVGVALPPPEIGGWIVFLPATALVVLMAGQALLRRDRLALAATAVTSIPLLIFFNPLVASVAVALQPYTVARLAALLGFTPWIAIAWGLSRLRSDSPPQVRLLTWVTLALAVVVGLPLLGTSFWPFPLAFRRGEATWVGQSYFDNLRRGLVAPAVDKTRHLIGGSYPVIAGDPFTVYELIGWVPARAAAVPRSHSQFAVEGASGPQRRADMDVLLAPDTSAERRREILDRWGATFVALDLTQHREAAAYPSMLAQPQLFAPAVGEREFVLLWVLPAR
jgi:hypothetical protein